MSAPPHTLRLLVVCPSWVGDAVMATPALRLVRRSLPGIFIGALVRPGIDEVLAGSGFFDEVHVARPTGIMGPKLAAAKVRPRRYDTALLLTNSFSSALITRIAGIGRRIGYDRDARGMLLTDRLDAPKTPSGRWAPVPAVEYYLRLACERLLDAPVPDWRGGVAPMELGITDEQRAAGAAVLERAGVREGERFAVLNPGGNNEAKRWPPERFALVAEHLAGTHGLRAVINGAPGEAELVSRIAVAAPAARCVELPRLGITLGALKEVVRRASLMVTNDTGPRHFGAALGVPLVSLFGPTDHRWTTIPTRPGAPEEIVLADPSLPESEVADDHPDRCRVDRITVDHVLNALRSVLAGAEADFPDTQEPA